MPVVAPAHILDWYEAMVEGAATLENVVVNLDLSMELEPENLAQSGDWTDFGGDGNPLEWRFPSHEQPDGWFWYAGTSPHELHRQNTAPLPLGREGEPDRISVVVSEPVEEGDRPLPRELAYRGAPPSFLAAKLTNLSLVGFAGGPRRLAFTYVTADYRHTDLSDQSTVTLQQGEGVRVPLPKDSPPPNVMGIGVWMSPPGGGPNSLRLQVIEDLRDGLDEFAFLVGPYRWGKPMPTRNETVVRNPPAPSVSRVESTRATQPAVLGYEFAATLTASFGGETARSLWTRNWAAATFLLRQIFRVSLDDTTDTRGATGWRLWVRKNGVEYVAFDARSGGPEQEQPLLGHYETHGYVAEDLSKAVDHKMLVQRDAPTENTTGITRPAAAPEGAVALGGSRQGPGVLYVAASYSFGGKEGPIGPVGSMAIPAFPAGSNTTNRMLRLILQRPTNRLHNGNFADQGSDGRPYDHSVTVPTRADGSVTGSFYTEPGRLLIEAFEVTGASAESDSALHATDPVESVDPNGTHYARGKMKVFGRSAGSAEAVLEELKKDASGAYVLNNVQVLGSLAQNGELEYSALFGPGGRSMFADTTAIRLKHRFSGSSRTLVLEIKDLAFHPMALLMRKPPGATDVDPYPFTSFVAIGPPPTPVGTQTLDRPRNPDGAFRTHNWAGKLLNQAYYFGFKGQAPRSDVYAQGYRRSVVPGQTYAVGVWMRWAQIPATVNGAPYRARPFYVTLHNEAGEVHEVGCVVDGGINGTSAWAERTLTFTVPEGYYELRVGSRDMGEGLVVAQEFAVSRGPVVKRTGARAREGFFEPTLDSWTPKTEFPLLHAWLEARAQVENAAETGVGISLSLRSSSASPLPDGSIPDAGFSAPVSDFANVPQGRFLRVRGAMTGDGVKTPKVSGPSLTYRTHVPTLLREDRSELDGGVIVEDLAFVATREPVAVHEPEGAGEPYWQSLGAERSRIKNFKIRTRTEAAALEIIRDWGKKPFVVEDVRANRLLKVRGLEEVEPDPKRWSARRVGDDLDVWGYADSGRCVVLEQARLA